MWSYDDLWLASFRSAQDLGGEGRREEPDKFDEMALSTAPQATIILSMTSGTTSLPKFAEVTHHQLVYGHALNEDYVDSRREDNWLSFSPMAWLAEQAFGFTSHLLKGVQVNFPEGPETVPTDMREIAPGRLALPQPRLGESGAPGAIPHQRQQPAQSPHVPALHADSPTAPSIWKTRIGRFRRRCSYCAGWANTPSSSPYATNWA